jgi:MinD superfamily P-loop ATPase
MKELVVISGKGGTGKTSIVGSLAALAGNAVLADCDVDAADLHLICAPTVRQREDFSGGKSARVKPGYCIACGKCEELCRFNAVFFDGPGNGEHPKTFRIDPIACEGCGVCAWFCAENAIAFEPAVNGQLFVSDTRFGPMIHARLGAGEENSGKLVTKVRVMAKAVAEHENRNLVIVDGSPGTGCPVIASLTGADLVLAVAEPTLSGRHDLSRVIDLTAHFNIPLMVTVNKWDINDEIATDIERMALDRGIPVLNRIRYDRSVTDAMVRKQTVVEHCSDGAVADIRAVWNTITDKLA